MYFIGIGRDLGWVFATVVIAEPDPQSHKGRGALQAVLPAWDWLPLGDAGSGSGMTSWVSISIAVGFNRRHKGHHIEPSEINFALHGMPPQWNMLLQLLVA